MHPVQFHVEPAERHSRLTAFFRLILVIPHLVVMVLWGIVVELATIIAWFAILVTGSHPFWEFSAGLARYWGRVTGYQWLLADAFPPFNGTDPYPVTVTIERPERHNRLTTFFRIVLVIPAAILQYLLNLLSQVVGCISWLVIIVTGRLPEGLANTQAMCLRFASRTVCYALLLVDRYPSFEETPGPAPGSTTAEPPAAW